MTEALEIPAALAGERLDRAVVLLSGRSRAEVAALIAGGRVRIAGVPVAVRHRRVEPGELLEVDAFVPEVAELAAAAVPFEVVHFDESLIVVDKPAGLVVHPGAGHREDTLAAGLLQRFPDLRQSAAAGNGEPERPGIVHRLDRQTSGLLVVARTPEAFAALRAELAAREVRRAYLALVLGLPKADAGTIEAPIGRSRRDPTRMTVAVSGRAARTHYEVLERFSEPPCALLRCRLDTGRTHQIRVHLQAIGHPVAGDTRYGGRAGELVLSRPFLHAAELGFTHPRSGEALLFSSPLPGELASVLVALAAR